MAYIKAPKVKIRWVNKLSRETGWVKDVHNKEKYFENTFDETGAKLYDRRGAVAVVSALNKYCDWNDYEIVTCTA